MAQNIFRDAVRRAGLSEVRVDSCGVGSWHVGEPADDRARTELRQAGYDDDHVAAVLGLEHRSADLLVAMDSGHLRAIEKKAPRDRCKLLRSFDPDAGDDLDVADPYYGGPEDFAEVRSQIEAAIPGLLAWVREHTGR